MGLDVLQVIESGDGAVKYLLGLEDGLRVESVLLRMDDRGKDAICISSQAGCALGCTFCVTGTVGLLRNLTSDEIAGQVHTVLEQGFTPRRTFNVSYMGMGEPLLNLDAVLASKAALEAVSPGFGFNVSTVGVVPGILRLADEAPDMGLQISLHAPSDTLRSRIMPINRRYPIAQVLAAAERFAERSGGLASINYVLISGVNDAADHALALAALIGSGPFSLQIVDLNPDSRIPYSRSSSTAQFIRVLEEAGLRVHYSRQLGRRDGAGCGQLDADYPSRFERERHASRSS